MRPIIGITQDLEFKEGGGFWAYLDKSYADAVYQSGGMPFMIPIMEGAPVPEEYARRIDGLLLSGGDDIHPRYYSEELMDGTMLSPDLRTDFDFALLREMLAQGKPVLGICLGIQSINVYFGGKLYQDIPGHKEQGRDIRHMVSLARGSRLKEIMGVERLSVNSYHHQAIQAVAPELSASAVSDDGIVEAVELPGEKFVVGVQWHPERMREEESSRLLFEAFIKRC
jgi:putative glutamine amidotransferase